MTAKLDALKAPFPAFGGKSTVADEVWRRFGNVRNYVEPFCFSAAVLLGRPLPFEGTETINDLNGYVANFWRAVQAEPDAVAYHADQPVNENDLMAWHLWLVERRESLVESLNCDPDFYDAKIAGRWCWGACCWIGSGWCSGEGPWHRVQRDDGSWQLVHLGNAGQGVNRQLVHLGNAGRGDEPEASTGVYAWMQELAERLKRVRVCCGDWERVCGPTPTVKQGLTAVFLDPPYAGETGRADVYGHTEDMGVAHAVRAWCLKRGGDKQIRVALAGYDGEHNELEQHGWSVWEWKARGGFGSQSKSGNDNCKRERIWFSPHCLMPKERLLF